MHLTRAVLKHRINRTYGLFQIARLKNRILTGVENTHARKEATGGGNSTSESALKPAATLTPGVLSLRSHTAKRFLHVRVHGATQATKRLGEGVTETRKTPGRPAGRVPQGTGRRLSLLQIGLSGLQSLRVRRSLRHRITGNRRVILTCGN